MRECETKGSEILKPIKISDPLIEVVSYPLPPNPQRNETSRHALPSRRSVATKLTGWRSTRPDEPSY